jgi:hypothetical protein
MLGQVYESSGALKSAISFTGDPGNSYRGYDMVYVNGNSVLLFGTATSPAETKGLVAKVGLDGSVSWARGLHSTTVGYSYLYYSGTRLNSGELVAVGCGQMAGVTVGVISRFSAVGDHLSTITFGTSGYDCAYSVVSSRDGGFAVASASRSFSATDAILVMKFRGAGTLQWSTSIDGQKNGGHRERVGVGRARFCVQEGCFSPIFALFDTAPSPHRRIKAPS